MVIDVKGRVLLVQPFQLFRQLLGIGRHVFNNASTFSDATFTYSTSWHASSPTPSYRVGRSHSSILDF
jgi:hypothetical protein